jgi:citronellol/citronellal dehydrogenase
MQYAADSMAGQIALVTGGRSGIGYSIAHQFLSLGAKVIIASRNEKALSMAASALAKLGPCSHVTCDIRKSEDILSVVNHIKERYGRLDILVNNAGGQFPALAEMISDNGWNAVINNNLSGTFFMSREMANHFFIPQQNGSIVNITANVSRGFPGMVHTGAARAGVENMAKTLALEWAEHRIRVNCVAPGTVESSGLSTYPDEIQKSFDLARKEVPLGRFATVQDIANAVTFMAGPLASYITGVTLYVDGAQQLNSNNLGLPNVIKSLLNQ